MKYWDDPNVVVWMDTLEHIRNCGVLADSVENIEHLVFDIERMAHTRDFDAAHSLEDALHTGVLTTIAELALVSPVVTGRLARAALKSGRVDFKRVTA